MRSTRKPRTGRLIVFEGPDGVGKSTISAAVTVQLQAAGEPVEALAFPGREPGTLGHLIYELHHDRTRFGMDSITPASLQTLHIAAHVDVIERVIVPALRAGRHVVLDRFWWSTWVYGRVSGIAPAVLQRLIDAEIALWGAVQPAVLFVVRREAPINRNHDPKDWLALRAEYDRLSRREQGRYPVVIVNNTGALDETVRDVMAQIQRRLTPRQPQPSETRKRPANSGKQLSFDLSSALGVVRMPRVAQAASARLAPARPSGIYDTFWRFAAERQSAFFRRLEGAPPPWTDDPIIAHFKFTNVYRASDRVSQYLIRQVIYRADLPTTAEEVVFRTLLFKLFNKIETWELLERTLGPIAFASYHFERYDAVLTEALRAGQRIYSAAYIMPPGGGAFGEALKHRNHLRLLERMMSDELPQRLTGARSMQHGFELLRAYPTIGDFLAYQFITDLNYSEITRFTEDEFVVPGPGALDGIRKCFVDLGGLNEPEIIRLMADRQDEEFARLGLDFRTLWGRPLQLIDCQNVFCEVSKYTRVAYPEVVGTSGRTRIKQRFVPDTRPISYWYPPKWGINAAVAATLGHVNVHHLQAKREGDE